jgi:hypothetical protein
VNDCSALTLNKMDSTFLFWTAEGEPIRRSSGTGTGAFDWPEAQSRDLSKSQTDLVGKDAITYADSDLCRTRLAQRMGLARSQCGQIKTTWKRPTKFPSAIGALNVIQARSANRNWNSPDDFAGKFLS